MKAINYCSTGRRATAVAPAVLLAIAIAGCGESDPYDAEGDGFGVPRLVEVAERGDVAEIEKLLRRSEPDVRDSCDWTPLMKAAQNGHAEAVERLLAAGASVDAEDKGGYTAMMLAASNDHAAVVERLLTAGAMVDRQERTRRWTALIWAAKQGHADTVAVLLAAGADRTLKDDEGRTAADWARETGREEILALLAE